MKIVVALDSFKGSLDACTACEAVATGLRAVRHDLRIVMKPLADGGEGTADILMLACDGEWRPENVTGPLPHMAVDAGYTMLKRPDVCVVEMASASGLTLLDAKHRLPLRTTTFGTGQLLKAAFQTGKTTWLAVGGSATVDGGVGAAMALGWQFLDRHGKSIGFGGGELDKLAKINPPSHREWPRVEVLCDVSNSLCGRHGAAKIFGPQKGATMRSGIETIIGSIGLRRALAHADWVITGEGSFDAQSLHGKVVSGVIAEAKKASVKVGVIAGRIGLDEEASRAAGISASLALAVPGITGHYAMTHARNLLETRAREFALQHFAKKS